MAKRQKPYSPKPWEGTGVYGDTFSTFSSSMQHHAAWKALKPGAKILYLACKDQYYQEKKHPIPDDPTTFTMNQAKWADEYGLYTRGNWRGFNRDMTDLIEHGFVRCLDCGAIAHRKSIYQFSAEWRKWGQEDFCISGQDMTVSMIGSRKRTPPKKL